MKKITLKSKLAIIEKLESKWLEDFVNFNRSLFRDKNVPSHDHLHHLRVWFFAKDIIQYLSQEGIEFDYQSLEALMISVFFHDTGLTKTLDETHGIQSKQICQKFFKNNSIKIPKLSEALFLIKHHDDKSYQNEVYKTGKPNDNLSILCVADDLDAFGSIGVFRYSEIYTLRGISINDLAPKVISNLNNRFSNFVKVYDHYPHLIQQHRSRYLTTMSFYEDLNNELDNLKNNFDSVTNAERVFEILKNNFFEQKTLTSSLVAKIIPQLEDEYSLQFFEMLQTELSQYED